MERGDLLNPIHDSQLGLNANVVCPLISATPDDLRFGQCDVNDYRDIVVTLTNKHELLPVNFEIPSIANYRCEPSRGSLMPLQNTQITVSFAPKGLGQFNQTLIVTYNNAQYAHRIYLFGECLVVPRAVDFD